MLYLVVSMQLRKLERTTILKPFWDYCIKKLKLVNFHCILPELTSIWFGEKFIVVVRITSEVVILTCVPMFHIIGFILDVFLVWNDLKWDENENYYKWTTCPNKYRGIQLWNVHWYTLCSHLGVMCITFKKWTIGYQYSFWLYNSE